MATCPPAAADTPRVAPLDRARRRARTELAGKSRITTIMPLSHPPAGAHHGGMTTAPCPVDALTVERFVLRNDRGLRRPLAALLAPTLDRQLAAGSPPESGALRAARAAQLVSAPTRRRLVRDWQRVLDQARRPPRARNPHAPLCRDRIIEAAGEVRALLGALATPLPLPARGVAMASRL